MSFKGLCEGGVAAGDRILKDGKSFPAATGLIGKAVSGQRFAKDGRQSDLAAGIVTSGCRKTRTGLGPCKSWDGPIGGNVCPPRLKTKPNRPGTGVPIQFCLP